MYIRDRNSTYIITATKGIYHFTSATQMKAGSGPLWLKYSFFAYQTDEKIEFLSRNPIFVQKSKFCSKIEVLSKNRSFIQKSIFWTKNDVFSKNTNVGQKFLKKSSVSTKINQKIILDIFT